MPTPKNNPATKTKKNQGKNKTRKEYNRRLSEKMIIEAIKGSCGIISRIAEKLNCAKRTIYEYIKKYDTVKEAYDAENEAILDVCEEGLFNLCCNQDIEAIKYVMDYRGKSRGYGGRNPFGETGEDDNNKSGILVVPGLLREDQWDKIAQP